MFDRPGESLRILAKILFWIELVAAVVLAIHHWIEYLIFKGWVVLIGGAVSAFASNLILAGFGDLVDNVYILKEYCVSGEKPAEEEPEEEPRIYAPGEHIVPVQMAPGYVQCPACMKVQRSGRTVCFECGRPFEKES